MFAARLREIRLAKGYTLDALATRMDGQLTKQAISKYERGDSQPRPKTLVALAKALGVKAADLLGEPEYSIDCLQYRTRAPMRERSKERVEAVLRHSLERRLRLEDRLAVGRRPRLLDDRVAIDTVEQAEELAGTIREEWSLGSDPIANLTDVLERQSIHVFEVPGHDDFDGLTAVARTEDGGLRAVGIAENPERDGDRQRFTLAHEVGHVVLEPRGGINEEDAANRFAGALLIPAGLVFDEVGERRSDVSLDELLLLKKLWGVSAQCILHRLRDLDVISQSHYEWWQREIDALGYRTTEPIKLEREQSTWERRNVARARAERLISAGEAAAYLGEESTSRPTGEIDRRALMKLSLGDRRAVLREYSERLAAEYEQAEVDEWLGADLDEPE
jgi:Zn-dependent peptidase ImmA (M78 family)/DNA-binding XRE family transcriptional regulator